MNTMDIINECDLNGKDMLCALKLIMDKIRAKGKDRAPELDADEWRRVYKFAMAGAKMGEPECMHWVADIIYGKKVKEAVEMEDSVQQAAKWLEKAVEAGFGRSATNLGLLHQGKPIPGAGMHGSLEKDDDAAFKYFMLGYQLGDLKAGRHIGLCYKNGIGVEKNDAAAFEWFQKAAERGDSSSALFVADAILEGNGTAQNVTDAMARYQALIDCKGHDVTTGAFALGKIYAEGKYVAKDVQKAKSYFESVVQTATGKEQDLKAEAEAFLANY